MTDKEELFKKLFASEAVKVKDMDDITLRAHREGLAEIAFEARARLSAVDYEVKERAPKFRDGFRNINSDDISSEAINKINTRQKKMTKMEKIADRLKKIGIDQSYIDKIVSARNFADESKKTVQNTTKVQPSSPSNEPAKPFVNPFKKN